MKKERQSNFEALRLWAMFIITFHHFAMHQALPVAVTIPKGINRFLVEVFMLSQGQMGVILFFAITAYFLCDSTPSLHKAFKKAWSLEWEVLFWSLMLSVLSIAKGWGPFPTSSKKGFLKYFISAFTPVLSDTWWFTTAYMGFLVLSPFLIKLLQTLTQKWHFVLSIIALATGLSSQIPIIKKSFTDGSGFIDLELIGLFIIIAYIRWYAPELFKKPVLSVVCLLIGYAWTSVHVILQFNMTPLAYNPAVLFEAFGWFSLFCNLHFQSKIVNRLAKHTFAVYLITEFGTMRIFLWQKVFSIQPFLHSPWLILYALAATLTIYISCMLLDWVRSLIFKVTVDRFEGVLFEWLWNSVNRIVTPWVTKGKDEKQIE
ncbi:acyltransferase [Bifidobacterium sp. ESL0682]|uniref:acyltransferase family protein n=1 Tax=Bifidobacterium sp. ESL0682 TaxID=2983212 RepID=UPI0023F63929|nr:acyltransferase [Bifidobacterium sp. ESL0682]WEV42240.1 acyltransferase [Bifidobacterium sp. ESL0682]